MANKNRLSDDNNLKINLHRFTKHAAAMHNYYV
jgi:hypothetical protein